MISRHLFSGALAVLLASTGLALLPAHAAQTELRLGAAAADVGNLDPHFASSTSDRTQVAWIFGALVRFAPGSTDPATIEPDLAESWQASDDKLVWTFKLRHGVQWQHDYGEVTAEDVAQAFLHQAMELKTTGDVTTVDGGNIAAALR